MIGSYEGSKGLLDKLEQDSFSKIKSKTTKNQSNYPKKEEPEKKSKKRKKDDPYRGMKLI